MTCFATLVITGIGCIGGSLASFPGWLRSDQSPNTLVQLLARGDTDIAAVLDLVKLESTSDVCLYGHEVIDERYSKYILDVFFIHAYSLYSYIVIETLYL